MGHTGKQQGETERGRWYVNMWHVNSHLWTLQAFSWFSPSTTICCRMLPFLLTDNGPRSPACNDSTSAGGDADIDSWLGSLCFFSLLLAPISKHFHRLLWTHPQQPTSSVYQPQGSGFQCGFWCPEWGIGWGLQESRMEHGWEDGWGWVLGVERWGME